MIGLTVEYRLNQLEKLMDTAIDYGHYDDAARYQAEIDFINSILVDDYYLALRDVVRYSRKLNRANIHGEMYDTKGLEAALDTLDSTLGFTLGKE